MWRGGQGIARIITFWARILIIFCVLVMEVEIYPISTSNSKYYPPSLVARATGGA
jgi:hypothetical protein